MQQIGIVVAADPPERLLGPLAHGELEPTVLVFRYRNGKGEERLPTREINPEELIMIVNAFLAQGRMEFGFRPRNPHAGFPRVLPGGTS